MDAYARNSKAIVNMDMDAYVGDFNWGDRHGHGRLR
jgi:hypothetical protein